ncbi:MAG TPA: hypothetical protein VII47_11310, partial [Actinomycetota bacterium]
AEAIEARSEGPGATWRMVLEAVSSSWDWCRLYTAVTELAQLAAPGSEEQAWAAEQITEIDRGLAVLEQAPVHEAGGLRVAVLHDSALSARVRPEVLCGRRTDVDAVGFVAGRGRLRLMAATPQTDLRALEEVPGLVQSLQAGVVSGSVSRARAEFSWYPGAVPPAPLSSLIDLALFDGAAPVAEARISRPPSDRRAKGSDPARLPPQDRKLISEALGSPCAGEPAGSSGGGPATTACLPAHRTGIEIELVPLRHSRV